MKIKKDMIFAVLTTFCMSALMFAVLPIRSGLLPPYDPWADLNADNKIDIKDISNVAKLFGALNTDNLTRNVNVTNWMPPEPTMIWCGYYEINSSGVITVSALPYVHVGDYEKLTVIMVFNTVQYKGRDFYLSAYADWMAFDSKREDDRREGLTSTLYQIHDYGPFALAESISTDSYPIKTPYVFIGPNWSGPYNNTAGNDVTFAIYVHLSNGATTGSLRKTMNWNDYEQSSATTFDYGDYILFGFSQITISVGGNVTGSARVEIGDLVDTFSFSGTYISRTYSLISNYPNVRVTITPSTRPWAVSCGFYVVA